MRRILAALVVSVLALSPVPVLAATVPAPVALQATGGAGRIDLSWQYGTYSGFAYFRVYRSIDGGNTFCLYDTVTWSGGGAPSFTDTRPATGWNVYYVTAVDSSGGESGRSNTAAAYPTSGGVSGATCDGGGGGNPGGGNPGGGSPGGGSPGGGSPGGGSPGGGDSGGGNSGGGASCDLCRRLAELEDILSGILWGIWDVGDQIAAVRDYLENPYTPLPTPPSVPVGPGYTPPPAPDLRPVMPQLGQRTGRPAPTVPTLYVPPDVPAPPALPDVQDPSLSPWGLPIDTPGVSEPPLTPEDSAQPVQPVQPQPALGPETPPDPGGPLTPDQPVTPFPVLQPADPLTPGRPLVPEPPRSPAAPITGRDRRAV